MDPGEKSPEALGRLLLSQLKAKGDAEAQRTLEEISRMPRDDIDVALSVRERGQYAVHVAAHSGAAEVVRRLLSLKPDLALVTTDDELQSTPLFLAASSPSRDGALECARLLLDGGADIEAGEFDFGTTPAVTSAGDGNEPLLRLLLSRGARTDARVGGGTRRTLLHAAAESRDAACVRTALEFGAAVDATDAAGETPLSLAAGNRAGAPIVDLLIAAGADVDRARLDGGTALMWAASGGAPETVAALLRAGARAGVADEMGWTAADWAAHYAQSITPISAATACLELLLCAGADAAAAGKDGRTPLENAGRGADATAAVAPLLLGFGSPLPADSDHRALVIRHLPEAAAVAQRQLEALTAPEALPAAAAALEARLEAAAVAAGSSSRGGRQGGADAKEDAAAAVFARLRLLRSGEFAWEEAWKHASLEQRRMRFSGAVDRLVWAQALHACARNAEPVAAWRAIGVLRQLSEAEHGSREWEKLTYIAARCVAKWWEVKQDAAVEAPRELRAAEDGVAAARVQGEATLTRTRLLQLEADEGGQHQH